MTAIHQPLLAEIGVAQEHIDGLGHELSAVDAELDALAAQREQYRLLEEACTTLESLAALGAGQAFWGSHADQDAAAGHLREVRARLAGFAGQVRATEEKRHSLVTGIKEGSEVLAILEGDLLKAEEDAFRKSLEWNVHRDIGPTRDGPQLMWARGGEEDVRLRKSLTASLLVASIAALLLPLIKIPVLDILKPEPVPERIVRFIELDQHRAAPPDRKSTRLNSVTSLSRMPSSA